MVSPDRQFYLFLTLLVATSFATVYGTQSMRWYKIIIFILIGSVIGFQSLTQDTSQNWNWLHLVGLHKLSTGLALQLIYPSLICCLLVSVLAFLLRIPVALGPLFLLSHVGSIWALNNPDLPTVWSIMRTFILVNAVFPVLAACFTWSIYRIFIQAFLFAEPEDRFKRTLAWSPVFYAVCLAVASVAIIARIGLLHYKWSHATVLVASILTAILVSVLVYYAFRFFFQAYIKRKAFLRYPQEYALYLERPERSEQLDREARGLGPNNHNNINHVIPVNVAQVSTSNHLTTKRAEELFRPLLILMGVTTAVAVTHIEAGNLMNYLLLLNQFQVANKIDFWRPVFWASFVLLLAGRLTFSERICRAAGIEVIPELAPSQAFAIQMGTLATVALAANFQLTFLSAPILYLFSGLAAIGTVKSSQAAAESQLQPPDKPQASNKSLITARTGQVDNNTLPYRTSALNRVILFWIITALMAFISGTFVFFRKL